MGWLGCRSSSLAVLPLSMCPLSLSLCASSPSLCVALPPAHRLGAAAALLRCGVGSGWAGN